MSDRIKTIAALSVSALALAVVVVGLSSGDDQELTGEERVAALAASIKCPFCSGESLAESPSSVAADYRELIAERVATGYSDEAIRQEFADNFGESFILNSTSSWSALLWIVPVVVLVSGVAVIVAMRRSAQRSEVGS